MSEQFLCPVCGYDQLLQPPWTDDAPSDEICPSCGTQFGFDDAAGGDASRRAARHVELRRRWIDGGCPWFSSTPAPADRDPAAQLAVFDD